MGILDAITSAISGAGGDQNHGQVAGGLVQEVQSMPGGIGGIFDSFKRNGMGGVLSQMAGGQTSAIAPDQVEQGLGGTGIIDSIAQRTGMSPTIVKMSLAVLLPLLIQHFVQGGHVTQDGQPTGQPAPQSGSILSSILGRLGQSV